MGTLLRIALISPALLAAGYGQVAGERAKTDFEVASIRVNPPRPGFHFSSDSSSGGPDSTNPGTFRCSDCTLATLIRRAFNLQNYQFPARSSLGSETFEVMAKIPDAATQEDFRVMLQNLLKERFGLTYHFIEKNMRGYHLVIAKNGPKLKESRDAAPPAGEDSSRQRQNGNSYQFGSGQAQGHAHNGLVNFNGSATFRGDHQTSADLARLVADQLGLPVDDQTKLQGKYDVVLNWVSTNAQSSGNHGEGAWSSGAGHGDHGGGGPANSTGTVARRGEESGPTLFEALQSQLGLKLVPSEQAVARILVIDHAERLPTAN